MTETTRPEPMFLADSHALDLLNSVAAPWGPEIEWLGGGRDLLAWLERAGLLPCDAAMRYRAEFPPEALDAVAAEARALREWFREFIAAHAGRPIGPSALAELDGINRLLARDRTYRRIEAEETQDADSSSLQWREHRRWDAPEDLLLPIAQAMGDLICQADFGYVKHCEGPTCTLWFHDVSKNHTRRWCSMAICGNRVKAAAHRAKKRRARA
jgi:predicted RNA-binding Zn ribbon-like protein